MFLTAFETSLPCCMSEVLVLVHYFIKSPSLCCESKKKREKEKKRESIQKKVF